MRRGAGPPSALIASAPLPTALPTAEGTSSELLAPAWPQMAFVEHRMAGDATNWWLANAAAVEAMLRTTGMRVLERPGRELWICERERPSDLQRS